MNGTKQVAAVPSLKTSPPAKPSQPSSSRRTTNNSLSNLYPVPTQKPPLPPSPVQTAPPPPFTSNPPNVHSGSITSNAARHAPPTVQTGSLVKAESPQMSSLNSPATLPAVDRLAPIRAVKASLASSTGLQSPSVNKANEIRAMPNPGANPPQTPLDHQQNPAVPQPAVSQQQPLSVLPVQSSLQPFPGNAEQGRPIPAQLEGVLRTLRSQFPQLGFPAQGMSNNAVNPAISGQNVQSSGMTGHPIMPHSMPGHVNTGNASNLGHTSQRYGVGTPQGIYNGHVTGIQANPNQASGPLVAPPWPSSSLAMSGNVASQPPPPTMNFSAPPPAGLHALPQRPAVVTGPPSNSMRAELLGPPSRSASSDNTILDGRRGSHNTERHRPPDNRRPNRHDRNQDNHRDKRNRFRPRS